MSLFGVFVRCLSGVPSFPRNGGRKTWGEKVRKI